MTDTGFFGIGIRAAVACVAVGFMLDAEAEPVASLDYSTVAGKVNPGLQSSSWAPRLSQYPPGVDDVALITNLHVRAFRTHDATYANEGLYLADVQCVFPLMHLDAKDQKNYMFRPTDAWLELGIKAGLEVFYRLGSSIEHTEAWGFGTLNPPDHAKYAEVCAGIVRHYNRGWADGKRWNIRYWELFNEPDWKHCWRGTKDEFIDLFITCLRRLKGEFPEIRVGGPAMSYMNEKYFRDLLDACRKAGVKPDFVSWHHYGADLAKIQSEPARMRALCAEYGLPDVELIVNEWHYLENWAMFNGKNAPEKMESGLTGATAHNGIDSGLFTLSTLARYQETPLSQSYFYGMGHMGDFGMADRSFTLNKVYHAMRLHGEITSGYTDLVASDYNRTNANYTVLGAWNADRSRACLLLADYRGGGDRLEVAVKGLDGFAPTRAEVLDLTRDGVPTKVDFRNGRLTAVKADRNSAAFLVTFERKRQLPGK